MSLFADNTHTHASPTIRESSHVCKGHKPPLRQYMIVQPTMVNHGLTMVHLAWYNHGYTAVVEAYHIMELLWDRQVTKSVEKHW